MRYVIKICEFETDKQTAIFGPIEATAKDILDTIQHATRVTFEQGDLIGTYRLDGSV